MRDPLAKRYCYAFDEFGVFIGMKRKIEVFEGELVAPKNSCEIKPLVLDGFKPVWNGQSWDQLANDSPLLIARRLLPGLSAALDEKKAAMLEHVIKDAKKAIYAQMEADLKNLADSEKRAIREIRLQYVEAISKQHSQLVSLLNDYYDSALALKKEMVRVETKLKILENLSFWDRLLIVFGLKKI